MQKLLLCALLATAEALVPGSAAMGRRACLLGVCSAALLPAKQAEASYAMGVAAESAHSWEATGKAKEQAVYQSIEKQLMEKREFRDSAEEVGNYLGGDYTSYRRGAARDKFEAEQKGKQSTASEYLSAEELLRATYARRMASP